MIFTVEDIESMCMYYLLLIAEIANMSVYALKKCAGVCLVCVRKVWIISILNQQNKTKNYAHGWSHFRIWISNRLFQNCPRINITRMEIKILDKIKRKIVSGNFVWIKCIISQFCVISLFNLLIFKYNTIYSQKRGYLFIFKIK